MAFQTLVEPMPWPFPVMHGFPNSSTGLEYGLGLQTNAANEAAFSIFKVPEGKGGTIKSIHFGIYDGPTAGDIELSVQTIDANGDPTGTLYNVNSTCTHTTSGSNAYDFRTVLFDGTFTLTEHDWIAVGWTADAVSVPDCRTVVLAQPTVLSTSFLSRQFTSAWLRSVSQQVFGFRYNDDSDWMFSGMPPINAQATNTAFDANDNPNSRGNSFTPDVKLRFVGWYVNLPQSTADYDLVLYDSTGELARETVDESVRVSNFWYPTKKFHNGAAIDLDAGTKYVVAFEPISTTITLNPGATQLESAALKEVSWYKHCQSATANNPTTQTNFTDDETQIYGIWPLVDAVDDGAGGGGGLTGYIC